MPRTLNLNVLGRFGARWAEGDPVELASKKAQALLAYLAVENGRMHTRDQLATLLWSNSGDERARHNLRQTLSKIRSYSDSLVRVQDETLGINLDACSVDVEAFQRLAKSNEPADLKQCIEIYRGELLDGMISREPVFDEWLLLARNRLHRIACDVCEQYVNALIEQGRPADAIEGLNRWLSMDPVCEPAHYKLMELLVETGRRSDALKQYQVCVDVLLRDLDAEPGAEITALHNRIRSSGSQDKTKQNRQSAPGNSNKGRDKPTVAVLPFENLSGDAEMYFVDGIVEDIITSLSSFSALVVIARGSSFVYRDSRLPDQQIANELDAQYLVRGSVQRTGNKVRINVQLLDAYAGVQLWGQRFDRELEDVFILQDEISSILVSTLAGQVEAARLANARKASPERLSAYDMILRGKEHHHRFTAEDCKTCIDLFERAIEQDPNYAVAYAWLACSLGQAMVFELDDHDTLVDRSQAAAERGLELDENEAESHRLLAQIYLTRRDLKRSMWHQERALFLNPNDDRSICSMGEILSYLGRHQEAEQWIRKSMHLNPYHPERYWTHLARPLIHMGRYQEAIAALEHIGKLRKDDHIYRLAAGALLGDSRSLEQYKTEMKKVFPDLDPVALAKSLPYETDQDRHTIVNAIKASLP